MTKEEAKKMIEGLSRAEKEELYRFLAKLDAKKQK